MRVAAVLLGGILYGLAFPPHDLAACGWLVLTPLLLALRRQSLGSSFRYGCLFGYASGWAVLWPLVEATAAYLEIAQTLAVPAVALWFLVVVGLPCGIFAAAAAIVQRRALHWSRPLLIATLWVASEFLRGRILGQPWGLLGYTQYAQTGLIQIAAVTGVYGVSFLLAAVAAALADVLVSIPHRAEWRFLGRAALAPVALLAACWLAGLAVLRTNADEPAATHPIAVIQTNVTPLRHWTPAYLGAQLSAHIHATDELADGRRPALIVWPEYAVPGSVDGDPGVTNALGRTARRHGADLLFGAPRTDGDRTYNGLHLFRSDGQPGGHYDKRRLVLFAEKTPLVADDVGFAEGTDPGVLSSFARLGVSICHEILHPDLIADGVRHGAQILVNVANDSWLEQSSDAAALQHLAMASFRAVETRRYLVRAAITGSSGVIDPFGRPVALLAPRQRGVLHAAVTPRNGQTPYVRLGDVFAFACLSLALLGLVTFRRGPRATRLVAPA